MSLPAALPLLQPTQRTFEMEENFTPYSVFDVPVCHSVIHVGDACNDIESCLRMDGLIKCSIVPPERFYHPVLPFRCNKKLIFCLCRMCVLTSSSKECVHIRDEARAFTGTWIMDEVWLAVEKRHRLLEL